MKLKRAAKVEAAPVVVEKKPVGRPVKAKPNKFDGYTKLKMTGKLLTSELTAGTEVIYSLDKCEVLSIKKASRKMQQDTKMPGLYIVSLHKHPRLGGVTVPCLASDYWYAGMEKVETG